MHKLLLALTALVILSTCTSNEEEQTTYFSKKKEIKVHKKVPDGQKEIYLYRVTTDMDEACDFSAGPYFLRGIFKASAEQSLEKLNTFLENRFGKADTLGRHYAIPDTICNDCFLEAEVENNQFWASFFRKKDTTLLSEEKLFVALKNTFEVFLQQEEIQAVVPLLKHYSLNDTTVSCGGIHPFYSEQLQKKIQTDTALTIENLETNFSVVISRKGKVVEIKRLSDYDLRVKVNTYLQQVKFPMLLNSKNHLKAIQYEFHTTLEDLFKLDVDYGYEKEIKRRVKAMNNDFEEYLEEQRSAREVPELEHTFYAEDGGSPTAHVENIFPYAIVLYQKKGRKWEVKQFFENKEISVETFVGMRFTSDLNNDGALELLSHLPRNMNGNCWANIYSFSADTIFLLTENFLNPLDIGEPARMIMHDADFKTEVSKFIATPHILRSWYMPHYNTLYKWENKKLVKTCIYGTELFPATMDAGMKDYFFVQEQKNGKLVTTQQFPLITDADRKKAAALEVEILKKYVNATILE